MNPGCFRRSAAIATAETREIRDHACPNSGWDSFRLLLKTVGYVELLGINACTDATDFLEHANCTSPIILKTQELSYAFPAGFAMSLRHLGCLIGITCAVTCVVLLAGCNTLGSLGFPTGTNGNRILQPAKAIANRPSQGLLLEKELAHEPLPIYIVQIGDSILIEPVDFNTALRLPGDQIVTPDGTVSLGEFGRLLVVNKTIEQIEMEAQQQIDLQAQQNIRDAFANERLNRSRDEADLVDEFSTERQSPRNDEDAVLLERRLAEAREANRISVKLVSWDSKKIYVLGEVNTPGSFQYKGNENVLDGIIEAGGLTTRANHHEIIVARPTSCGSCKMVMKVCYDQIVQLGDATTNYQLRPGDRIFVPSLTFCDDLKQTFLGNRYSHCPRCSQCPTPCELPEGCEPTDHVHSF